MTMRIIGYKCGMSKFFNEAGMAIPVSVVKIYSNYIVGLKKSSKGDKFFIQISARNIKKKKLNKSLIGFYDKINVKYCKYIHEFKTTKNCFFNYNLSNEINMSIFDVNSVVDVFALTKGKGFSGVIRRHNFKSQRATHGNSKSHNVTGSIGQCQTPGKVFKGKKMPGRMGYDKITIKNLKIVKVFEEDKVVLLKGSIPGFVGGKLIIKLLNIDKNKI